MEAAGVTAPAPKRSVGRRLAGLFHGRPRLQVGALLAGPVGWLVIGYLGSLAVLLITAFWTVDALSGEIERTFTLDNFETLVDRARLPHDRRPHGRDRGAGHGHRRAARLPDRLLHGEGRQQPRCKALLVVAVLMPLWSSYLVKVYAWRTILCAGRGPQLGARPVRASTGPATASSPSGW